jgi:hypothetical protein
MVTFEVVRIDQSPGTRVWAVERTDNDGSQVVVGEFFATQYKAEIEASRLTIEAARGTLS